MNNPEIMIYLAITNPKNTIQYGGVVCAPIVKEALQESFQILDIKNEVTINLLCAGTMWPYIFISFR